MDDLISRQAAIDALRYAELGCELEAIEALPSVERKKGKWVAYIGRDLGIEGQWMRDDGKTVFVQCDQCGELYVRNFMANWNYCPNCGADMRGEADG